jgi:hypothetical protein
MSALPAVLAADPWVPPRQRAVLSLAPIEREAIRWEAGEREKYLSPRADDPAPHEREARRHQEREAFLRGGHHPHGDRAAPRARRPPGPRQGGGELSVRRALRPPAALAGAPRRGGPPGDARALPGLAVRGHAHGLGLADSTRVARFLAAQGDLEPWRQRHPETAGLALLPAALGPDGDARKAALKALKAMRKAGQHDALRGAAAQYGPAAVEELEALFAPPPLPPKAPKLPPFVQPDELPALALADGTPVPPEAKLRLLQLASLLPQECARAAIDSAAPALDRARLSDLADALLRAWLAADAPTKEKWVLYAAALFGDDRAVRALVQKVEEWHEARLSARARLALKAIAALGSDVALMHLSFLTRKKSS